MSLEQVPFTSPSAINKISGRSVRSSLPLANLSDTEAGSSGQGPASTDSVATHTLIRSEHFRRVLLPKPSAGSLSSGPWSARRRGHRTDHLDPSPYLGQGEVGPLGAHQSQPWRRQVTQAVETDALRRSATCAGGNDD